MSGVSAYYDTHLKTCFCVVMRCVIVDAKAFSCCCETGVFRGILEPLFFGLGEMSGRAVVSANYVCQPLTRWPSLLYFAASTTETIV